MNRRIWVIILLACLGFIVPFGFYLAKFHYGIADNSNDWSNFGSYIGGISGSIFSFLGFLAIAINMNIQSRELVEAKNKIEQQKKELASQKIMEDLQYLEEKISTKIEELVPYYNKHIQSVGRENLDSFPGFKELTFLLQYLHDNNVQIKRIYPETKIIEFYSKRYNAMCQELNRKELLSISSL